MSSFGGAFQRTEEDLPVNGAGRSQTPLPPARGPTMTATHHYFSQG
jgi:hypothetical protein